MNTKNQFESDRIEVIEKPEELIIEISGKIPQNQFMMLTAWLIAWTVCGVFVISQLFSDLPQETKSFMIVWLAFWFYFEYKIGIAWLWRKFGKEILTLKKGQSTLEFKSKLGGKAVSFDTSGMRDFELLESKKGVFIKNYYDSFWVVGGESISFVISGQLRMFGRQLKQSDAEKLLRLLKAKHKKYA